MSDGIKHSHGKRKKVRTDRAKFLRSAVVEAYGGDPGPERLQDTYYVKRRHIKAAYGFTDEEIRLDVKAGVLVEVHFR